jgi:hypothetical protein
MQLCLTVQIPKKGFNGLEGKAIYIGLKLNFFKNILRHGGQFFKRKN